VEVPPDAWARDPVREHEHDGWRIVLPPGVIGGPVARLTNPELTTAAIFRGWVESDPMFVGVMSRPRRVTCLLTARKKELVVLTVRRHPAAALDGVVDAVVRSFALVPGG
jgi:hypothetical protein